MAFASYLKARGLLIISVLGFIHLAFILMAEEACTV
jgi:hypothetical protein